MNKYNFLTAAGLLPLLTYPLGGAAADSDDYNQPLILEEVVVTAQRRSENLNKVPIAVTAFSGDKLESAAINELNEIAGLTPGLYLSTYTTLSPQIFLRGVGSNDDGITSEGAVGIYLDDVYVGRASSAMFDLYDLERIEILRGPQGTLYGRNTVGGAINILTKKPGSENEGGIEAEFGNYNRYAARGYLSGPVIEDRLFLKLAASIKRRDGWTKNTFDGEENNDEDSMGIRTQLVYTPQEALDITISADFARDRPTGSFKEVVGGNALGFYQESGDRYSGAYDLTDAFIERDIFGLSAKLDWRLSDATFTSVTGYRDTDIVYTEDYDSTSLFLVHLDTMQEARQLSQEFRLTSAGEGALSWITGLFYLHDEGRGRDIFALGPLTGFPNELTQSQTDTNSYAAFGELAYRMLENLKVTLGLRYTYEEKELVVARQFATDPLFEFVPRTRSEVDFDDISPKLVVDYDLDDNTLLYASVTKGFKSGGYNNFPADVVTARTAFLPEEVTAYELGVKARLGDGRLQVNGSGFYYDYTDLQVFTAVEAGAFTVVQIRNAAEAEIYGAELEFKALLTPAFNVGLSYAYLHAEYQEFGVFSGNQLTRAPERSASFEVEYRTPVVGGELAIRVDAQYSGKVYFTPSNDPDLEQAANTLANARIAYLSASGGWDIAVFGKNLTDETYLAHGIDTLAESFDIKTAEVGAPRQYGVTFGYHF